MLDAGSVTTELRFKMDPSGALKYDAAIKQVIAKAAAAEAKVAAAQSRLATGQQRLADATHRAAQAGARFGEAVPLKAMDQWEKNSGKAAQNLKTLGSVGAKTATVGFLALGAATIYAATKATTFNREMLKISTQAGGSAKEVAKLKAEVLALAGQVPQGPQQLAEGLYHIQSAGFRGAQSLAMLKAAAMGAALGNADLQDTTQAMIAAMASNIKGVKGSADAMGQLNAIVGVGDMRMQQLAQAMATGILPSAHDAGLSLTDVGAALATVTDNATPANVTATRLRMTIALMAAPSKAATKALESIGLTSTSLAHDMRQPNGLLKAVEDLKTHLKNSGKSAEEQDAILTKVFGGGKSSAVIHTLISEIGRLKTKYDELGKTDGVKRLQHSWAEFQKSEAAGFGELKSGVEAFAITVGNVLMPELTKLAHGGAQALQSFISGGGAAKAGHDIEQAFSTLGQVASNLAPPLKDVAGALIEIGKAAGLTNAGEISALLAGFLAFRAASFVGPILMTIAAGISEIGLAAATAGSLSAFGADMVALAGGPVSAVAIALGAAAGAFMLLKGHEESEAQAAEHVTKAKQEEAAAINAVHDAVLAEADATFGAAKADTELDKAKRHLADVAKQYGTKSSQYKQALDEEREAALRDAEAHDRLKKAHEETAKADARAQAQARERVKTAKELFKAEFGSLTNKVAHGEINQGEFRQGLISSLEKYNAAVQDAARGTAVAAISQIQLDRVLQGQPLLADNAAAAVAKLTTVWGHLTEAQQKALAAEPGPALSEIGELVGRLHGVSVQQKVQVLVDAKGAQAQIAAFKAILGGIPAAKVIQILTSAHTAGEQVAALRALLAGVPPQKVLRIIHNAGSAKAAIQQLGAAARALPPSRSIDITTNAHAAEQAIDAVQAAVGRLHGTQVAINILETVNRVTNRAKGHASGRRAGASETALVGEGAGPEYVVDANTGRGQVVNRPTLMGLSPSDYVIPLEDRYRGRALGLFAMLARDLGLSGYAHGRKGHARHRSIPPQLDALSLPLEDIEQKVSSEKAAYDKAHGSVKSLSAQVATDQRDLKFASSKGTTRAKDRQKLREAQTKLRRAQADERKHEAKLKAEQKALRDAKAYQAKIQEQTDLANIAANDMRLADGHNDEAGYQAAKGRRVHALQTLRTLLAAARQHVKGGNNNPYFRKLTEQIQGAELEEASTGGEEPAALSPEQERQLKGLEASVSLAALTPGLGDDTAAAQALVGFLEGALGQAEQHGAGPGAIKELADQVATARSNLASLTGAGGTNENPDVQAQLEQERQRRESAEQRADTNERALRVLGGPGDIGAGGANAAAAVTQNIYTLHPGDPKTLRAIGDAATAGIGYQGGRRPSRVKVGPP